MKHHFGDIVDGLYAVQEIDGTIGNNWCTVQITRDRRMAHKQAKNIRTNYNLGIIRRSRVIKPRQFVVTAFLACGNAIT